MSKSKFVQGALAASYLALEAGCAATPPKVVPPQPHYELMAPPETPPPPPDRTFRSILDHCKETHKTVFDCFYDEPPQLVKFAKRFYDHTDQWEEGAIPDPYLDYDLNSFHQYEKDHPDIHFQLDEAGKNIDAIDMEYEGQTRRIFFDKPVELRFYTHLVSWIQQNLHAIIKRYGTENHFKDPITNQPVVTPAYYNGNDIDKFSVDAGQFMTFSPTDSPERWLSYKKEPFQVNVEKILKLSSNGNIEAQCPLPGCDPNEITYIEFNGKTPQVRRVYQGTQTHITKFASPVCRIHTDSENSKFTTNKDALTMKEWECELPNGLHVEATVFPREDKGYGENPLKPKRVRFGFPDERRHMEVTFGRSGNPNGYERDEKWTDSGHVLLSRIDKRSFYYSPLYERPYYSRPDTDLVGAFAIEPNFLYTRGHIVFEDGTEIGQFHEWKKAAEAKGEKVTAEDYLNLLARKLKFPVDFYSFAKLCGSDTIKYTVEKGDQKRWATAWNISTPIQAVEKDFTPEVWTSAFVLQEILRRQGIKSEVIDTNNLVTEETDQKKIPNAFHFPTVLWMTHRPDGKFDVNFFNIWGVGRDGVIYNPEADNGSEKAFQEHKGFSNEEDAFKAWFKLLGKSEAEADAFYHSGRAMLWKLLGKKFPSYHIGKNGKLQTEIVNIDSIKN